MRNVLLAGVVATLGLVWSGHAVASEGFDDLAKLAKSGVNDDVMLAYIDASPVAYELTVDEILFFNDLGLAPKVVAAAVKHGKELRATNPAPAAPVAADDPPAPRPALAPPPAARPVVDNGDVENVNDPVPITQAPVTTISEAPQEVYSTTTVVAPPPEQANLSFFYDALSPYGSWINLDGNYVWQPNTISVDPNWRPYCQRGHWVYTDAGWAWQSDYSWGWAPFHYGRWSRHDRYGWVWSPDTTWGPAWVSWRNDGTHAGWAPLPPRTRVEAGVGLHFGGKHVAVDLDFGITERDYTFVPVEHVCETNLTSYYVRGGEVSIVYNRTSYVRDNYSYDHDRVFNRGISVEFVAERSHRDIRPITIVDVNVQVGAPIRGTTVTNSSFAVYRPAIKNEAPINPEVVAARREEEAKRVAIRQQAATEKAAIRQQNSVDRTAARQEATTAEVQARRDAEARKVQAAAEARAAAAESRAQTKEQRDAEVAAREQARQAAETKAKESRLDNAAARQADAEAKAQARRDAEAKAAAARQDNTAARQADLAAKEQARRDAAAKDQADDQAREQARRDAAAKAAAERQQNAAARKADEDAREQARRDALAKAQADRQQAAETKREQTNDGSEARKADQLAKEQARRDAEAKAAADRQANAAAREQARKEAAAKEAAEAQARKDARAAAAAARNPASDGQPDPNNPNDPDNPKPNKKKKKNDD